MDNKFVPLPRASMKESVESLIHYFKLFSKEYTIPPGEMYSAFEVPKGEMTIYLVSSVHFPLLLIDSLTSWLVNIGMGQTNRIG